MFRLQDASRLLTSGSQKNSNALTGKLSTILGLLYLEADFAHANSISIIAPF